MQLNLQYESTLAVRHVPILTIDTEANGEGGAPRYLPQDKISRARMLSHPHHGNSGCLYPNVYV